MEDNIDVVKELEIKNQELFVNKIIIDLETAMESLMLFYSKKMDDNKDNYTYCDMVASDVINNINSFLDNPNDVLQKEKVSALVNSFFYIYKNKVNTLIPERLQEIKKDIQNIDSLNYEMKLNNESSAIIKQISDYYQENIYMLIEEIKDSVNNHQLVFQEYLIKNVHDKLINMLKDKLIYSIKLINNNYDENTAVLQIINEKTLK